MAAKYLILHKINKKSVYGRLVSIFTCHRQTDRQKVYTRPDTITLRKKG